MKQFIRKFTKHLIALCNIAVSISMLFLYLLPYSNQSFFWFVNLFALVFPFLVFIQLGFLLFWFFAKRKFILIPIITIVLCWPFIYPLFAVSKKVNPAGDQSFSVASWNVHLFDFYENDGNLDKGMMQQAAGFKTDVLALQELVFSIDTTSHMSLDNVRKQLGYKYAIAGNDRRFGVHTNAGKRNERYFAFCVALFSNHPIIQWKKVQSLREYNHTFIWADIKMGNDTIRFFNVHLQSMHFAKDDYDFIETIDNQGIEEVKKNGRNILKKMRNSNVQRAVQINAVKEEVLKSPYPVVLCGDFNDVPNSYAYQTINDVLKDAFITRGNGIGRTFTKLSPTLRIDFMFYSPLLITQEFKILQLSSSDHRPLISSFQIL